MRDLKLLAIGVAAFIGPASASLAQEFAPPLYPYNAPPPYGYGFPGGRPLQGNAIVDRIEAQGYDDVGRPRFDGSAYQVDATARGGFRVRLIVDPRSGYILRRIALRSPVLRDQDEDDTAPFVRRDRRPAVPYGAWSPSPYDEMPVAEPPRPASRREASRPAGGPRPLGSPADPRLAPPAASPDEPEEPDAPPPPAPSARQPTPPGDVFGTNPDKGRTKAKESIAARPPKTAPDGQKTAPGGQKPASQPPTGAAADASADSRKPVRVIDGVTPMNILPSGAQPPAR